MNIFRKSTNILAAVFMFFTVATPATVSAQAFDSAKSQACRGANLSNNQTDCRTAEATSTVNRTVRFIVNTLSIIVGVAAVIMIIVNGLRMVVANGDTNNITSARNGVIYALVGIVIVAFAQIIVRFVLNRVG
jgi:hypothetical protein